MRLLDRYILRNFFEPFLLCFGGFIGIMLIFDLFDNFNDFIQGHASVRFVVNFYLSQLPAFALLALPVGLLLALLFSLSRMSRHNEIISMLTAGVSVPRVIVPLAAVGVVATGFCFALNVSVAPHAEQAKRALLDSLQGGGRHERKETLEGHLFLDRMHNRIWFVRKMKPNDLTLAGVQVTQQQPNGDPIRKIYANRATYNPKTGAWALYNGMIVDFDADGVIIRNDAFLNQGREITTWSETPQRIASSQLQAQNLSIDELRDYLKLNSDYPVAALAPYRTTLADRWAFPWSCLVLVFIAAPLGIVYNRRGVLGGVVGALSLFLLSIVSRHLLLALGKGGHLDPQLAGWLPQGVFLGIGFVLLWYRSTNRDFPKLTFWL